MVRQGHDVSQMTCAICWEVDKSHVQVGKIEGPSAKKPFKYTYSLSGNHIPVYEVKSFPNIFVGTEEEEKEHLAATSTT